MADIKLFVCCHQPTSVPEHPLLVPIQVGAALAEEHFPGFLYDDTGENISLKNRSYCELTAQYWAWKNVDADYYGFFHYRRYLYPDINAKRPYRIERKPSLPLLDRLGYAQFAESISQYDMILPKGENMYVPVRDHYANASFHHRGDLELAEQIVRESSPAYVPAMETYFSHTSCYFGNIFIMRKPVFHDYCTWLFPILEEFDRRADISGYAVQARRVDGYLAERLLGVYRTHHLDWKTLELPRVHFEPRRNKCLQTQILYSFLPPGTRWRSSWKRWVKRVLKTI